MGSTEAPAFEVIQTPPVWSRAAAVVLVGSAMAGCGGGDEGSADYGKTYQGACVAMQQAATAFQAAASRINPLEASTRPDKVVPGVKRDATVLLTVVGRELGVLARAKAPEEYAAFQTTVRRSDGATQAGLASARAAVARIRTVKDFKSLDAALGRVRIGTTQKIPKSLAGEAPACKAFGSPGA